jgi:hypothetical protein
MADPIRNNDVEQEQVRSSNDADQQLEREGTESERNQGYDDAVRGQTNEEADAEDIDPDSAEADVDRDDSVTD